MLLEKLICSIGLLFSFFASLILQFFLFVCRRSLSNIVLCYNMAIFYFQWCYPHMPLEILFKERLYLLIFSKGPVYRLLDTSSLQDNISSFSQRSHIRLDVYRWGKYYCLVLRLLSSIFFFFKFSVKVSKYIMLIIIKMRILVGNYLVHKVEITVCSLPKKNVVIFKPLVFNRY